MTFQDEGEQVFDSMNFYPRIQSVVNASPEIFQGAPPKFWAGHLKAGRRKRPDGSCVLVSSVRNFPIVRACPRWRLKPGSVNELQEDEQRLSHRDRHQKGYGILPTPAGQYTLVGAVRIHDHYLSSQASRAVFIEGRASE